MLISPLKIGNGIALGQPVNPAHPLNKRRVAWWLALPGRTSGPKWFDLMGQYHGTLTNGPTWRGTARQGGCGELKDDGSNDYVTAVHGGAFAPAAWTAAISVRVDGNSPNYPVFIANTNGSDRHVTLGLEGSTLNSIWWSLTGAGGSATTPISPGLSLGQWYRLVLTFDASFVKRLYINGTQVVTETCSSASTASPTAFFLGGGATGFATLDGALDNGGFWNRALSATEVVNDYRLGRIGYPGVLNRTGPSVFLMSPPPVSGISVQPASMLMHH